MQTVDVKDLEKEEVFKLFREVTGIDLLVELKIQSMRSYEALGELDFELIPDEDVDKTVYDDLVRDMFDVLVEQKTLKGLRAYLEQVKSFKPAFEDGLDRIGNSLTVLLIKTGTDVKEDLH